MSITVTTPSTIARRAAPMALTIVIRQMPIARKMPWIWYASVRFLSFLCFQMGYVGMGWDGMGWTYAREDCTHFGVGLIDCCRVV